MTAARHDLTIDQGADFSLELTIKESASVKNLTDWYPRAQLRKNKESASATAAFTASVSGDVAHGKVLLQMPWDRTDDITAGVYYYDLELYNVGEGAGADATPASILQVLRIMGGQVHVRREVTR